MRCVGLHSLYFIHRKPYHWNMSKGITATSAIMTISGRVVEVAPGVLVEEQVSLQLDILNREVLLVYAIDLNVDTPDAIAATDTFTAGSLSNTSRTAMGHINNTNVLSASQKTIRAGGFVDGGVSFTEISPESPPTNSLSYIGIVSTNDFFVQIQGNNNNNPKGMGWRMWCARAKVTADIYAALVQSETLSA